MSFNKTRITLTDTLDTCVSKLAEGNPGAISVLVQMTRQSPGVDPQNAMGSVGPLLSLDTHGIYGSRIWMLYKDICGQDIVKTLAALRACQLGLLAECELINAIDGLHEIDADAVLAEVKARLSHFDLPR